MRLICPNCGSQYEVDVTLFPDEGREVQCSNCETVWVQQPVAEEPPLRLDAGAAAEDDDAGPARPSERLDEEERAALARAVRDELAVRDGAEDGAPDDKEIVSALREQIAAEGGNFEKGDGPRSQKRNLAAAAASAGVDLEQPQEEGKRRRWGFSMEEDDDGAEERPRDGLAAALAELEKEEAPVRRRRAGRAGFLTALVASAAGVAVYLFGDQVIEAYPPAAPYLEQYRGAVDSGRGQAEALYAQYEPAVRQMIADFMPDAQTDAPLEE